MSKKDYEFFAGVVRQYTKKNSIDRLTLYLELASYFEKDNKAFNRGRFSNAYEVDCEQMLKTVV